MYPTAVQLDELCTIIKPSFPQMDTHEQTDYRYRIRDAYHLVTTGQQPVSNQDEDDVKRALPQLATIEADREKAEEQKATKIAEIKHKLADTVAKIQDGLNETKVKADAAKAEATAKADAEIAKVEAEAAKALEALDEKKKETSNGPKPAQEPSHPAQRKV